MTEQSRTALFSRLDSEVVEAFKHTAGMLRLSVSQALEGALLEWARAHFHEAVEANGEHTEEIARLVSLSRGEDEEPDNEVSRLLQVADADKPKPRTKAD